jgi:hypothetical protein
MRMWWGPDARGVRPLHIIDEADLATTVAERFHDKETVRSAAASEAPSQLSSSSGYHWPLVQWQDTGLWIREWWFEPTGANFPSFHS